MSLKNNLTSADVIGHPASSEAWRMVIVTGRHTRDFVLGSGQTTVAIHNLTEGHDESIEVMYDGVEGKRSWPIRVKCVFMLQQNSKEILAHIEIENSSDSVVEEVEFPVIGGITAFKTAGRKMALDLVAAGDRGDFAQDGPVRARADGP